MREIKFRAWDTENECFREVEKFDVSKANRVISIVDTNGTYYFIDGGQIVLQQYTGLKDKNGVEIYSSDILKDERERTGVVVELRAGQVFMWINEYKDLQRGFPVIIYEAVADNQTAGFIESCEIIGNIYENPELLTNN